MRLLTLARDLRRRKSRERHFLFVAEGVRAVDELLSSSLRVRGILLAPQLEGAERGKALHDRILTTDHEIASVTEAEFRSAAETESPQGVLAIAEIPVAKLDSLRGRSALRLLVLDGLQDPGNAGTILRTALALGVDMVVSLPGTVDLWNAKVVRGAMGASFHLPLAHVPVNQLLEFLHAESVALWATDVSGEVVDDLRSPEKLCLAVGNEGAGLSSSLREHATRRVSLPIAAAVESLNVAVATGILLYLLRK